MTYDLYDNPLISRYASRAMSELFSPQRRIETWRRLWIALAEAELIVSAPARAEQGAESAE